MPETRDLYPFVVGIVLVGMLLGVGFLTFEKFGQAAYDNRYVPNETWTGVTDQANVTFAHGNITKFVAMRNSTGVSLDLTTTINSNFSYTDKGIYTVANTTGCAKAMSCYVDYYYNEYGTATAGVTRNMTDAVGAISSTWLSLIVTVFVLAIILGLVIKSFSEKR